MSDISLVRSLSLLIGPPDGLGAIPALQRCQQWAQTWQNKEPACKLADQLIIEISETLANLRNTNRLNLLYFPVTKRIGQNVFTGHSLSTSPLWSLTPITINGNEQSKYFDDLAAVYLSWVIKTVDKYVDTERYKSWISDHSHEVNPAKTVLSSVHEASLSIRRLVDKESFDLIEELSVTAWSHNKNTFSSILLKLEPEEETHKRIKRLRSLFHLAHGFRPLYRRISGAQHKEKVSNIRIYSGGIASIFHPVDIPDIGSAVIHTPTYPAEDIYGEDTDAVSLVGININSLTNELETEDKPSPKRNFKKLYAIAAAKAKHIARANHFDQLDARRLHPEELRLIDGLILDNDTSINHKMAILISLLSGRSIENIRRYPVKFMRNDRGAITLQLTINKPKIESHPDCLQTEEIIYSPIPRRWIPVIEEYLSKNGDIKTLTFNGSTSGINRTLKTYIKNHNISATKIHKLLPLALLDSTQDDGVASLFADPLTAISTTKNHYLCISKNEGVEFLKQAWLKTIALLDGDKEIEMPCPQNGYIGSANVPSINAIRSWVNLNPFAIGTFEKEFFDYRKQIIREGLTLAHRGVTDPKPEFLSDPNPDLKSSLAFILDKNRGGKGQMTRIAFVPSKLAQAMRRHDERAANYIQGGQTLLYPFNARTPFGESGTVMRPKDLERTDPCTPFPANGPRKLYRSHAIGKIPGELADASMGWQTHGLVPYSEFSSLAPYMSQACSSKHNAEFYELTTNQEENDGFDYQSRT